MIITISEVLQTLRREKRTCIISFQLENEGGLLKVFVRAGEIRSLALGPLKNRACLAVFPSLHFREYTFIAEAPDRIPDTELNPAEAFSILSQNEITVRSGKDSVYGSTVHAESVDSRVLDDIGSAVCGLAGPVGGHILEQNLMKLGCGQDRRLSRGALRRLLHLVAQDLPAEDRTALTSRFATHAY